MIEQAPRACVICGGDARPDKGGCTNGCCHSCHHAVCTPGGNTTPGHNLTNVAIAARRADLARKK